MSSIKEQQKQDDLIVVKRKELLSQLSTVTNASKKSLWSRIKDFTGWTSSRTEIEEGTFKYKIEY